MKRFIALGLLSLLLPGCAWASASRSETGHADDQSATADTPEDMGVVQRIIDTMLEDTRAHETLTALCDNHGHRLSGSQALEDAIDWAIERLKADGQENVRKETVSVPKWVRGQESLHLLTPREAPLFMLGLGGSVGTPKDGIKAEVLTVTTEDELIALGEKAKGKIIVFNNPMPTWTSEEGACYGRTVRFRVHGARLAAAQGAVAVLVRSVTAHSLRTPHTGALFYGDASIQIPAAAISTEDADFIARRHAAGESVSVHLKMEARMEKDVPSSNVVAELVGRDRPDEIVIISGHIDSWDVGQGAHDDGSGVAMAMETLNTLRRLGLRARRTIRLVLWTNEENGMAGAKTYLKSHQEELNTHVAAIEADAGGFAPDAFGISILDEARQAKAANQMASWMPILKRLGDISIKPGRSAPDVSHFKAHGVPAIGLYTYGKHYFDYHHTEADTVDKVDAGELTRSAAAMAAVAWLIADMPGRLGEPADEPAASKTNGSTP